MKHKGDIRRDLQFTAYAMIRNHADARPHAIRPIKIVEITKTKIPQVHIQPTERDQTDFKVYREIAAKVATAIRAGIDFPVPSFLCGSCSVRNSCPLNKK